MTETTPAINLVFIDSHIPGMLDGDYRLTVQQSLSIGDGTDELTGEQAARQLYFSVAGPRFSLDPSLIKSVFPPDKGVGRYANVLPHIIFHRSTLPWEREISAETPVGTPWIALLTFVGDEIAQLSTSTITAGELQNPTQNPVFPGVSLEVAQSESDTVAVVDVPMSVLSRALPLPQDLALLAHVREITTGSMPNTGEANLFPILVSSRLPIASGQDNGCEVKVVLVSLEGRTDIQTAASASGASGDETPYRMVMLKAWQYTTLPLGETFTDYIVNAAAIQPQNPQNLLRMDMLSGTDDSSALANSFLGTGFVPLPHQTRQGNQLFSWYRSPFVTGAPSSATDLSTFAGLRSPDQLVRYITDVGMLDTSYAAAWQIGQMLTLQNNSVSTALYNWKRAQALLARSTGATHLPVRPPQAIPMPQAIRNWLAQLALLEHIPFNYLVPSEQMLPSETLRFFTVDAAWRAALLDGAFSVGRVLSSDAERDMPQVQALHDANATPVTGFLLRSHVVEGWPHLEVEGYSSIPTDPNIITMEVTPLPLLRMERLAPDILLCLFSGTLQTLELHEVPETIHFGLSYDPDLTYTACNADAPTGWYKYYRMNGSAELSTDCAVDVGEYVDTSTGRVNVSGIAAKLAAQGESIDSAPTSDAASHPWWVAYQMIEGVQRVRLFVSS